MFIPGIFTHFLCANFSATKGIHARANFDAFCISPPLMLISLRSQEAASENNFDDDDDDSVYWIFAIKISKKIRISKFPNPENRIPMLKSNQIKACSSNCIFEVMFQLSSR